MTKETQDRINALARRMALGERVAEARTRLGASRRDLAEASGGGLVTSAVFRVEQGRAGDAELAAARVALVNLARVAEQRVAEAVKTVTEIAEELPEAPEPTEAPEAKTEDATATATATAPKRPTKAAS